jgi:hypothetical protein
VSDDVEYERIENSQVRKRKKTWKRQKCSENSKVLGNERAFEKAQKRFGTLGTLEVLPNFSKK